jgi:hypothetical protein
MFHLKDTRQVELKLIQRLRVIGEAREMLRQEV